MSNVKAAWRSLDPEVTAVEVLAAKAARTEALDKLEAFVVDRFGPEATATAFQRFDGSFYPTGFALKQGLISRHPVPDGMRYDSKTKSIVPAKRTPEGKAIEAELDTYRYTNPFVGGLGGIICGFNGDPNAKRHDQARYLLGWTFHVFGDQVFAVLPVEHLDDKCDLSRWQKAPLSEYHAAKEAHEGADARGES